MPLSLRFFLSHGPLIPPYLHPQPRLFLSAVLNTLSSEARQAVVEKARKTELSYEFKDALRPDRQTGRDLQFFITSGKINALGAAAASDHRAIALCLAEPRGWPAACRPVCGTDGQWLVARLVGAIMLRSAVACRNGRHPTSYELLQLLIDCSCASYLQGNGRKWSSRLAGLCAFSRSVFLCHGAQFFWVCIWKSRSVSTTHMSRPFAPCAPFPFAEQARVEHDQRRQAPNHVLAGCGRKQKRRCRLCYRQAH